jgi:protocatechuate 3,4-dioxygenase beta subunit
MLPVQEDATKILPTSLKITVVDELGNPAPGTEVKLYATEKDYMQSENALENGITDSKGVVKFKKLKPEVYYIEARKGNKNNDGGGVATEPLQEGRVNKVNTVIQ